MNAITQSEIFALISEINAFADNSETLINNSRSAYEKNKQALLNRHNSSLSQLEETYGLLFLITAITLHYKRFRTLPCLVSCLLVPWQNLHFP